MSSYSLLFATIHKTLMQPTSSISITFPADKTPAPFGNSRISVGVGNTIVSFAFFGVGPSIAAYAILKVLEENEETWNKIKMAILGEDSENESESGSEEEEESEESDEEEDEEKKKERGESGLMG